MTSLKRKISPPEPPTSYCIICLEEETFGTTKGINCRNKKCKEYICQECICSYITHSEQENVIPRCPKCKMEYLRTEMLYILPSTNLVSYDKCCYNYLTKQNKNAIDSVKLFQQIKDKIKQERYQFVSEQFAAIKKTIDIVYKKQLNTITQKNIKILEEKTEKKFCMLSLCKGYLNENFKCLLCETEFCKKCERIKTGDHKCKEEDCESVSLIETMIKCPKCYLPVEKSSGCNNMTCANCKTNFCYRTGELTIGGGHSTFITLKDTLLSETYRDTLDPIVVKTIKNYEYSKPKPTVFPIKQLLSIIQNTNNLSEEVMYKKVSILYEHYSKEKQVYQQYMSKISEIEHLITTEGSSSSSSILTLQKLEAILSA
jgi:hypothetical protein